MTKDNIKTIKKIGLIGAIAIVTANMMGSGIALLPSDMAGIGSITLISWLITFVGALALAYIYARLGATDPQEGGPVAYAGKLAPILGFQVGLLYWGANWIGNLAIAVTGVAYLSYFVPLFSHSIPAGIASIGCVWIFTLLNFWGADKIAHIVSISVILLLIPVVGTAIFGWDHFTSHQFVLNWNVSGKSSEHAIFAGILLAIWSFIGIESASVGAGIVDNPKRTIPLATMIGITIAAVVYIASMIVISGMFPANAVAKSSAPFALSFGHIIGHWVEPFVAAFTAIACLTSLSSWMMLVGQAGIVAAKMGTLPKIFAKTNKKGIPGWGLIINSLLMTVLMVVITVGGGGAAAMFGKLISIAALLTVIPYFYSALQLLHSERLSKKTFIHLTAVILASAFCFTILIGATLDTLLATFIIALACFVLYVIKFKEENHYEHHPDN